MSSPGNGEEPTKGVSPVTAARAAQAAAEADYEEFAQLDFIQHIEEIWEREGVKKNDPVWLVVQTQSLFARWLRDLLSAHTDILKKNSDLSKAMFEEVKGMVDRLAATSAKTDNANIQLDALLKLMGNSAKVQAEFCKQLPGIVDSIHRAHELLDQRSNRAVWLNVCIAFAGSVFGAAFVVACLWALRH